MNEDKPLYQQIADWVRQEIMDGRLSPGERLPSVRQMTASWGCTPGTVQRAYAELSRQGLVISRHGQGTHVIGGKPSTAEASSAAQLASLRRASLVHRAETFLLETLTAGYQPEEIEFAVRLAMDRWRVLQQEPAAVEVGSVRFAGSHDPAVAWIAAHFSDIAPGSRLQLAFNGSLGGLIALAQAKADFAGSHLWDSETDTYNSAFVRKVLPGRRIALVTLAHRRLGLILPPNNPAQIVGLADLARPELVFVNRQPGSGVRVWLDACLHTAGIDPQKINGYTNETSTHTTLAERIAEGNADLGFGLQTAALAFGLDFIPFVRERYDLVIPAENLAAPAIASLLDWLNSPSARQVIEGLGGYETASTGRLDWLEA